ncbi:hypothetical protein [Agrococcus versicolor]
MADRNALLASLRSAPTGEWPLPPVISKPPVLPIGSLTPENAERLFSRLLETDAVIEEATLYGVPGQAQEGIDVYARISPAGGNRDERSKTYVALQSRRVQAVSASAITKAIDDFLGGSWADRCARFYYATSANLRDTKLDAAIRSGRDRLAAEGIAFVAWGVEEVSTLLRDEPRIVDDLFGPGWAVAFCSSSALQQLERRMSAPDARAAREALRKLYHAAFQSAGAPALLSERDSVTAGYVMLDTHPVRDAEGGRSAQLDVRMEDTSPEDPLPTPIYEGGPVLRRRSSRSLARTPSSRSQELERQRIDEWAESGSLRLLLGGPGTGKSCFLMFAAMDLLATSPQSAALQRAHSGCLPLWLPFAFLCRHLQDSTSNSVATALRAWVTLHGAPEAWDALEPALEDERSVLIVDGIDEWSDRVTADQALGLIETFIEHRHISAIVSARPHSTEKLHWTGSWRTATLAPMTPAQQVTLVGRALAKARPDSSRGAAAPQAETFLAELARFPALQPLLQTPLFLNMLARTWRGESLPTQRFALNSALLALLLDRHPQMRRRASHASGSDFSSSDVFVVLRGVAYSLRKKNAFAAVPRVEMVREFRDELCREDGLAYPLTQAARLARAMLAQAEDEYGIVVPHGAGVVSFLHRVLLDQLAGEHLASVSQEHFKEVLKDRVPDPSWRDVLMAALAARADPQANSALIEDLERHDDIDPDHLFELIASAIASEVAVTADTSSTWVGRIIERVDNHPLEGHRSELIEALVSMTKFAHLQPQLMKTFARWLRASDPEPVSALWALREPSAHETEVLTVLLWGLRHRDDDAKLNAAHAIAARYSDDPRVGTTIEKLVQSGTSAVDQAYALLCLGTGWPTWPKLPELLAWAREQSTPELRVCAIHLLQDAEAPSRHLTDQERGWLVDLLRDDNIRPTDHWERLAAPLIQDALAGNSQSAAFVLETLSTRNGGNRSLAWLLACTTHKEDGQIRAWVVEQLAHPERHGLALYNLALMPDAWYLDGAFLRAASVGVKDAADRALLDGGFYEVVRRLPDDEAKATLLDALDAWRPAGAAAALLRRFPNDRLVRSVITDRLRGSYSSAAPLAPVAVEALGDSDGLELLAALLREPESSQHAEERVVVAMSLARAWRDLAGRTDDPRALAVLARNDADDLATRCVAVDTNFLSWHVDAIIAAWPENPAVVEFAERLLVQPRRSASGIADPTPAAVIRAYGARTDDTAARMMSIALGRFAYLPPQLREVLVGALTRSDLSPKTLSTTLKHWPMDPDLAVQRTSAVGLIRRLERYRLSPEADADQVTDVSNWLREQTREELCAYGPAFQDRRQTAWVSMLMLGDLRLHDGLRETIGNPTQPGTALSHLFGGLDRELIELVNRHWVDLFNHFGEDIFHLLNQARRREANVDDARRTVLGYLSTSGTVAPAIESLLLTEASPELELELAPSREYLLWKYRRGQRDRGLFTAFLDAAGDGDALDDEDDPFYARLVDSSSWELPIEVIRRLVVEHSNFDVEPALRALFCELFPDDVQSRAMFEDLERWFGSYGSRESRSWRDTLAISVRCSTAEALPVIYARAHLQIVRRTYPQDTFPLLTSPLVRRIREDDAAATEVNAVLRDRRFADTDTPVWSTSATRPKAAALECTAQDTFLMALALRQAGRLDATVAAQVAARLIDEDATTVVHDPFTGRERSVLLAAPTLLGA